MRPPEPASVNAPPPFTGDFTLQQPIAEPAIEAAVSVLRSGRLHRYNTAPGQCSEAALLEQEYAQYQGARFCLACASGGYAMAIALRAAGLQPGEPVLTNAFTLSPVPGAIANAGGQARLVGVTTDLVIDLDDLADKAATTGARYLLLSHMRGHLVDMARLVELVEQHSLCLIEDCAHTMGAQWGGRLSGGFGLAGCFSTQTYKHLNSGEGGLLTSDDESFMARAIVLSGSYMLYERHLAAPPVEAFDSIRLDTPNCSGRMDNLRAAILRPQLQALEQNIECWNTLYRAIEAQLSGVAGVQVPQRAAQERYVGSSFQFLLPGIEPGEARRFVAACQALGVELKWFGDTNPVAFTSRHQSWTYLEPQTLPATDAILDGLFDVRLPLSFSQQDAQHVGRILGFCVR